MMYTYSILSILGSKSWGLCLSVITYTSTHNYNFSFLLNALRRTNNLRKEDKLPLIDDGGTNNAE